MLKNQLPEDVDVIKIDVPVGATPDTPWVLTKQSRQVYYFPKPAKRESLSDRGSIGYELRLNPEELEKNSDLYALLVEKRVSVTPMSIDMTSRTDLSTLESMLRA